MSSGSGDQSRGDLPLAVADDRYGPAGYVAVVVTTLLSEALAWTLLPFAPYLVPVVVLPAAAVAAILGYGLSRVGGAVGRIGRGVLIGCWSGPLTAVLAVLVVIAGKAVDVL